MADFVQPVNALFTDARLTDGDRTVYCLLLSFADYGTLANCRPSVATVAKRGGRDRSAVVRSLTKLVELGWVTRQARKTADGDSDTSMYSFPFQVVGVETHLPSRSNAPTVVAETHRPVVAQMHLGVVAETHHNLEPVHQDSVTDTSSAPAKPKRVKKEPTPKVKSENQLKAEALHALWVEHMPGQTHGIDGRFHAQLARVYTTHGAETLIAVMKWCAKDRYRNGEINPCSLPQWCAEGRLPNTMTKWKNATAGMFPASQPVSDYKEFIPRAQRPAPPKEQP